ncbi:uncharacterized membrane protein YgdD (TMEM256/DUF423 family) [Paenibacillus jamilae]|jgi:uncharacterized membrane protein YgdD (TMEM256/DUF423 family)|uniref:UPF0382 membrane protein n=2 Tax=Paenibacillus polymyxa TaxID=1406 RepID=A0A378XYV2_PAEPO|nr:MULTISPECIES: DUF423 domain-containing protein [Paenibacillus]KAF6583454.1 DUF423 domain-containing protein [Paenibacillus sp. EKM211P]KAF6614865.1 DUF423 domain-containing protein [Paenibacillus sp. EKM101P]KAF6618060.1 DUF423 domain-containing protein [Paenibacillus sp. EKM102P]KAF6626251.1 DUF423 domain-containing protein [Paenibacillus sp. EKM10P]KAF6642707.1 DUF423 domain-containing protein [Paenibacillus sp. EKM11P]
MKVLLLLGCIVMFLAVALGAFGAHALKKRLSADMMSIFQTGIQYQIAHGLGLLLLGVLAGNLAHSSLIVTAGWVMLVGILLFSGSLYVLSVSGVKKLGAVTPIGGLAFLASWVIVIVAVIQG